MLNQKLSVLVVDDEELFRETLRENLIEICHVCMAANKEDAFLLMKRRSFDIAFIDLKLGPDYSGIEVVKESSRRGIYSVVLSGHDEDEIVEMASKAGCQDFFTKGEEKNSINEIINKYFINKGRFQYKSFFEHDFITQDKTTIQELEFALNNSESDIPIMINGETGIGKTVLARKLHQLSKKNGKFVQLNCSEISNDLFESEIFGHKKGSFTGAISDKIGRIKLANNGTLFIDEIDSCSLENQTKLLKVLEEKIFYPVGSDKEEQSHFRLICASQKDLLKLMKENKFRKDLYYRISGINLYLRPLRDRPDDITLHIKELIRGRRKIVIKKEALDCLKKYSWPGNIRELISVIKVLKCKNKNIITVNDLPQKIIENKKIEDEENFISDFHFSYYKENGFKTFMRKIEKDLIMKQFKENNFATNLTIKQLGVSNSKFYSVIGVGRKGKINGP